MKGGKGKRTSLSLKSQGHPRKKWKTLQGSTHTGESSASKSCQAHEQYELTMVPDLK